MKCLTVCQPWAYAIARGPKRIENRSWPTNYRGPLLLHAASHEQWLTTEAVKAITELWPESGLGATADSARRSGRLVFGAIVAVCRLAVCCKAEDLRHHVGYQGVHDARAGGWANRVGWCWILADVRPLATPIPMRGAKGIFEVAEDLARRAMAEASGAAPGPMAGVHGGLFAERGIGEGVA